MGYCSGDDELRKDFFHCLKNETKRKGNKRVTRISIADVPSFQTRLLPKKEPLPALIRHNKQFIFEKTFLR
jgi:hypothetical protein